jgi:hypothetical protein
MKSNPVGWFEIYIQDMERAKRFYESVFQGKLQKLNSPGMDMWAFPMEMNGAGSAGALVKMHGVSSGGGGTIVYFRCDDCAVEQRRVVQAGGKIHKEKFGIGEYGFISLVEDPDGNMLGLHSMK